jgi:outer membrane lipoprotein-sorting protein
VEVFAKAPGQRTIIAHTPNGDEITTCDGRDGWIALPDNVVPLVRLTGGDLDGAKVDAMLSFPARIKQSRSQWRVGTATIDDHDVEVVEGTGAGLAPVKFYFDKSSGLLVRMVRFTNTIVGQVTTQVDYSNYRAVSGVKMPFKWITTRVDGQSTIELSDLQPNASIDPAKFGKPAAAPLPKPAAK